MSENVKKLLEEFLSLNDKEKIEFKEALEWLELVTLPGFNTALYFMLSGGRNK